LEAVLVVLILVTLLVVVVLALVALALRRRRAATRARRDDEIRASLTENAPDATDGADSGSRLTDPVSASSPSTDPWGLVDGAQGGGPDAAGPPAAIQMAVTGTDPWVPARVFVTELIAEGYETTVDLADLVVVRDGERLPVTVREPTGPPGHLIVTSTPERLARTLEILVRSLLAVAFTVDSADGREVRLTDDDDTEIHLTVTELALA
jgi:uncharacterized membrane protein